MEENSEGQRSEWGEGPGLCPKELQQVKEAADRRRSARHSGDRSREPCHQGREGKSSCNQVCGEAEDMRREARALRRAGPL